MERATFYEKNLRYVLSFDADLGLARRASTAAEYPQRRDEVAALGAHTHVFDSANEAPVYNALSESRVLGGELAVTGHLRFLQERAEFMPSADYGRWDGRLVLYTEDRQVIEAKFDGFFRAGHRWHWVQRGESAAEGDGSVETKAFLSVRFETGSSKYKWIVGVQCVAYGLMGVLNGDLTRVTFDVYAMA
ncbi:MAG TPA: DUF3237 family protein [Polyangiaceae bacterium]|nr:DUF3237 family protein [Polyangiaceae bacterium]